MIKLKILIPMVILVAVGGMLGALYTQVWNPLWNPFVPPREEIVERAIAKMMKLESLKTQGNIDVTIEEFGKEKAESFQVSVNFLSNSDIKNAKSSSDFEITLASGGLSFAFAGELRAIKGDLYFVLKTLPTIPLISQGLKEFKNQWFKIDKESLIQRLKVEAPPTTTTEAADEEKAKKIVEEFIEVLKGRKFFKVEKDLGAEEIDGVKSNHYLILLKEREIKEAILEFLPRLKKYLPEEEKASYEEKLQEIMVKLPQNFEKFFSKVGPITFGVWISRDSWLRRVKLEKEIDLSQFEQFQEIEAKEGKIKIAIDFNLSDFNQKVKVEVPEEFKPLEEILPSGLFGSFTQKSLEQVPELPLPSEGEGLPSFEEFQFEELPSPEEMKELERLLEELQKE